ncbi:MAG: protein kinase [Candidatus Riflebacteria bacterium]|nr:protein kinase [Candidatus Riflebacteria bacterium]
MKEEGIRIEVALGGATRTRRGAGSCDSDPARRRVLGPTLRISDRLPYSYVPMAVVCPRCGAFPTKALVTHCASCGAPLSRAVETQSGSPAGAQVSEDAAVPPTRRGGEVGPATQHTTKLSQRFLSQYRIQETLGAGAMGVVYKAVQLGLDREVAIKVPSISSPELMARFVREGRILARLEHANLVRVYDAGEDEGQPYIVFEFVRGHTLRAVCQARLLPVPVAVGLCVQMLEGLGHAHRHHVLHRDVKSDNALVTADGTVKLADFGLARSEVESGGTCQGLILGTAAYMSPEQAQGLPLDARADLYSAAVVLFELLTQRLPFESADTFELLGQQIKAPPPLVGQLRPEVPPDLQSTIAKALSKQREDRFLDARSFAEALGAVGPGELMELDATLLASIGEVAGSPTVAGATVAAQPALAPTQHRTRSATGEAPERSCARDRTTTSKTMKSPLARTTSSPALTGARLVPRSSSWWIKGAAAAFAVVVGCGLLLWPRPPVETTRASSPAPARSRPVPAPLPGVTPSPSARDLARGLRQALDGLQPWARLTALRALADRKRWRPGDRLDLDRAPVVGQLRATVPELEERTRAFEPVRDDYFGSLAVPLDEKRALYRRLQELRELELACGAYAINVLPRLYERLSSPRYGMASSSGCQGKPGAIVLRARLDKSTLVDYESTVDTRARRDLPDGEGGLYLKLNMDQRSDSFLHQVEPANTGAFLEVVETENWYHEPGSALPFPPPDRMANPEILAVFSDLVPGGVLRLFLSGPTGDRWEAVADLRPWHPGVGPETLRGKVLPLWHGLDPRLLTPGSRLRIELVYFREEGLTATQIVRLRLLVFQWSQPPVNNGPTPQPDR